jgi:hypothetical protein
MTEPVHDYDPNTRYTACKIKAWPSHTIAEAETAPGECIQVGWSQRAVTCETCLTELARRAKEKRNGR